MLYYSMQKTCTYLYMSSILCNLFTVHLGLLTYLIVFWVQNWNKIILSPYVYE